MFERNVIKKALDSVIATRKLLDHPFYQKWTAGLLKKKHLKYYAREYFHFVLREPQFLSAIHSKTPAFPTPQDPCGLGIRQKLLSNLMGEEHGEENHPHLWTDFCFALGLTAEDLLEKETLTGTKKLLNCFEEICHEEPFYNGISAMYAFESQIPEVAKRKIEGLQNFYGITDEKSQRFFSVHQEADVVHSSEELDILHAAIDSDEKLDSAKDACQRAAEALLSFLSSVDRSYCSDVPLPC